MQTRLSSSTCTPRRASGSSPIPAQAAGSWQLAAGSWQQAADPARCLNACEARPPLPAGHVHVTRVWPRPRRWLTIACVHGARSWCSYSVNSTVWAARTGLLRALLRWRAQQDSLGFMQAGARAAGNSSPLRMRSPLLLGSACSHRLGTASSRRGPGLQQQQRSDGGADAEARRAGPAALRRTVCFIAPPHHLSAANDLAVRRR